MEHEQNYSNCPLQLITNWVDISLLWENVKLYLQMRTDICSMSRNMLWSHFYIRPETLSEYLSSYYDQSWMLNPLF